MLLFFGWKPLSLSGDDGTEEMEMRDCRRDGEIATMRWMTGEVRYKENFRQWSVNSGIISAMAATMASLQCSTWIYILS